VRADKLFMFAQRVVLKIIVKKGKGQAEGSDESERLAEEAADAIDASANPDPEVQHRSRVYQRSSGPI
jgi:hypothetical protein